MRMFGTAHTKWLRVSASALAALQKGSMLAAIEHDGQGGSNMQTGSAGSVCKVREREQHGET